MQFHFYLILELNKEEGGINHIIMLIVFFFCRLGGCILYIS